MATTWEFYVAMVLVIILILIVIAFVLFLMFPQKNIFDKIKRSFKKKKEKGAPVSAMPSVSRGRVQARSRRFSKSVRKR